MADASDVEIAIAQVVSAALYPNGTSQPSAIGAVCKVIRGWPVPADLDADLAAQHLVVSVFSPSGTERNTTRFPVDLVQLSVPTPTITATILGQTITFAGTIPIKQNIGVTLGDWSPAYLTVVYPAMPTDTMTTIAAGLAALLVAQGITATSSGPMLTLPATSIASARVGVFGTVWQELKRQERCWMITLWCPTPAMRDVAAPIIDIALCKAEKLLLSDGSGARMVYERGDSSDERQLLNIYRRDFLYRVEYGTTVITQVPQIISTHAAVTASQ